MTTSFSLPQHALTVLNLLESAGYEAFVVGGCVRDCLMGLTPQDWDVCTNATPEDALRVFSRFHCIKTGLQHGTITVMVQKQAVEITTYRLDGDYTDNRHPDAVTFVSDIQEDLARRDFTINAMAYHPHRGLIDCFGGQQDLEAGLIRCVGLAAERFEEDGLRLLRALRFASRFSFNIESSTTDAIRKLHHLLKLVSEERIFKELKGILVGKGARSMMMDFPELFETIMPELAAMIHFQALTKHMSYSLWDHTAHVVEATPTDARLRLAALFHDAAKPFVYRESNGGDDYIGHADDGALLVMRVLQRLKCDNATMDFVRILVAHHDMVLPTRRATMRRLIGRLGLPLLHALFELRRADLMSKESEVITQGLALLRDAQALLQEVLELPACFTVKDLAINGKDLIGFGLAPGPQLGQALEFLLGQVQEELLENDALNLQQALIKKGIL